MKRIIVALPTCGKTYACKQIIHDSDLKAVDLDIRGSKSLLTPAVRKAQTLYAKAVLEAGCDVLFTHNGALDFRLLDPDQVCVDIVIRDCTASQYAEAVMKRGDSLRFIRESYDNYEKWVDGMWTLFDNLSILGFRPRVILLGLNMHIWDYLASELDLLHCDCKERN